MEVYLNKKTINQPMKDIIKKYESLWRNSTGKEAEIYKEVLTDLYANELDSLEKIVLKNCLIFAASTAYSNQVKSIKAKLDV